MELQDYFQTNMLYVKRILDARTDKAYSEWNLNDFISNVKRCNADFYEYILYPLNPVYDYFTEIGIKDDEMPTVLATLFYIYAKEKRL